MPGSIDRQPETWKPPIATGTPAGAQRPRDVHRPRELVRLHADQKHQAEIVVRAEALDELPAACILVLISSAAVMSIAMSSPSALRCRESSTRL